MLNTISPWQSLRPRRKLVYVRTVNPDAIKKWEKTGLLSQLSPSEAAKMAELMERTAYRMIRRGEAEDWKVRARVKDNFHPDQGHFMEEAGLVFPLVRRIFSQVDYELGDGTEKTQAVGSFSVDDLFGDMQFMCGLDMEVEVCHQLSQRITAWIKAMGCPISVGKNPLRIETLREGDDVTGYFVSVDLCPLV